MPPLSAEETNEPISRSYASSTVATRSPNPRSAGSTSPFSSHATGSAGKSAPGRGRRHRLVLRAVHHVREPPPVRRCRGRGRMIVMTVTDALARPLRDLRISVTDRCNFRCVYCMPREVFGRDYEFLERAELLTFEEIERLARIFVGDHGVSKVRLTGGEPLVRRELERLPAVLARIPGLGDLAMTTNGSALARKAWALADAGLRRITVSLDSLDNEVFAAINDVGFPVERVLAGIDAAAPAGAGAGKNKKVVKRGINEHALG